MKNNKVYSFFSTNRKIHTLIETSKTVVSTAFLLLYFPISVGILMWVGPGFVFLTGSCVYIGVTVTHSALSDGCPEAIAVSIGFIETLIWLGVCITPIYMYGEKILEWWKDLPNRLL